LKGLKQKCHVNTSSVEEYVYCLLECDAVPDKHTVSIIGVGEQANQESSTHSLLAIFRLMMKTEGSSETLARTYQNSRRHVPEGAILTPP
jgi:hypothetical protein